MSALTRFHEDIGSILEQARGKARSAVNAAMVEAYWLVGRRIVEEEQRGRQKADYGARLIEELSTALTADFGKGFSYANLYNCRQFYLFGSFPRSSVGMPPGRSSGPWHDATPERRHPAPTPERGSQHDNCRLNRELSSNISCTPGMSKS